MKKSVLLQHIVRVLESTLGPESQVWSPRFIVDSSGTEREVDVYIEEQHRHEVLRTMIECRAHKKPVDIGYIDSVAQKSADLGRPRTFVVSTGGFQSGAEKKAALHGIKLSTVEDVDDEAWPKWIASSEPVELSRFGTVHGWVLHPTEAWPDDLEVPQDFAEQTADQLCLYDEHGTKTTTFLLALNRDLPRKLWDEFDLFEITSSRRDRVLYLITPDRRRFVHIGDRPIQIFGIGVDLEWGWAGRSLNLTFSQYRSLSDGSIKGQIASTTLSDGTLAAVSRTPDGKLLLTGIPPKGKKSVALEFGIVGNDSLGRRVQVRAELRGEDIDRPVQAVFGSNKPDADD